MKNYFEELCGAMTWLNEQEHTLFLGQTVSYPGTALSNTVKHLPDEKLWEMPVCEDMQMGMTIGMAMNGTVPISIFPRWNFLLLGTNQIVNHLDKLKAMLPSSSILPKVIVRTAIGSISPLNPGPQHVGDYTEVFRLMCPNIDVVRLDDTDMILPAYKRAYERQDGVSSIIIEWADAYDPEWYPRRALEIE
jgi:pyruvate/2-oxoglutarate/acetoin dehydrogenase E1 component